jgi:hypothetical protein
MSRKTAGNNAEHWDRLSLKVHFATHPGAKLEAGQESSSQNERQKAELLASLEKESRKEMEEPVPGCAL